jgi:hypothetical protein
MEYGRAGVAAIYSVVQTEDSGLALAGYKADSATGHRDFYLAKTDANGALLWEDIYGGDLDDVAHSVVQTDDGGYVLGGHTRSFGAGGLDFWVVKTDENGGTI